MRVAGCIALLMVSGALVACGSKSGPGTTAPGGSAQAAQAPKKGEATAAEVAEEMRGDLDCPAKVKTAKRAADAAVIDVVGVRPGLTYEEAAFPVEPEQPAPEEAPLQN